MKILGLILAGFVAGAVAVLWLMRPESIMGEF